MSKPYTKEMWTKERKEALGEYLISSRKQTRENQIQFFLFVFLIIFFSVFLYYFQDIVYYINHKDTIYTQEDEIQMVADAVTSLVRDKKIQSNSTIFMADLYQGKYGITISPIFSHTTYSYQCLGYILVEDGNVNTNHYCEMYE
jgi:predicted nucleic acid-binding Zn ribbon protein